MRKMQGLTHGCLHTCVLEMIGLFYVVTMKSVFSSLSFQGVKDVFGSLFLIKEGGERGIGIPKRDVRP